MTTTLITVTELALAQIGRILQQEGLSEQAVRVGVSERTPTGFVYQLDFCDLTERRDDDAVLSLGGVTFYVNGDSVAELKGATIDYVDTGFSAGFKFDNPNKPKLMEDPVAVRVHAVIEQQINPGVAAHGGRVTLMDVRDGTAYVRLSGGCQGCGQADTTVRDGIEAAIRDAVPEIHSVLDVTDHAAGERPFYAG